MRNDWPVARTVLIVDDDSCFRLIAREMLERGGFDVLGEAGSGAAAVSAALDLRPDVVLLDVQLPDTDGFAVARLLSEAGDAPCVVLCSVRDAEDYAPSTDRSRAAGFLTKADLSADAIHRLVADARLH